LGFEVAALDINAGKPSWIQGQGATPVLPGDSNRRRMLEGPEKIHSKHLLQGFTI
jgi:hypothetical protein